MTLRNPNANESVEDYDKLQTAAINDNDEEIKTEIGTIKQQILTILSKLNLISDWVIEYGSNTNGSYEKWASGKLVQWGSISLSEDINTTWGSLFTSVVVKSVTFPIPFIDNDIVIFKDIESQSSNSILKCSYNPPTININGWSGGINPARPTASTNVPTLTKWYAIGRWKV